MRIASTTLVILSFLNLLAFVSCALVGVAHGVNAPFPLWFKNSTDACFFVGLTLFLLSLPFIASVKQRTRASLSASIRFCIDEVVLVGLHERLHKLRRNEPHIKALLAQHVQGSALRNKPPCRSTTSPSSP